MGVFFCILPRDQLSMQMPNFLAPFQSITPIEFAIYLIILGPTCYAMIFGAPFVPTRMEQVDRMLKAAKIKKGQKVYDLGCGDGRLVYKAAKEYGANAVGYEFSPLVWLWARFLKLFFWRSSAKVQLRNFWHQDISDADVIVCYLLPFSMEKMEERLIKQLKKGTLIVSHAFRFPNLKEVKRLPRKRSEKLGPVWIYKI